MERSFEDLPPDPSHSTPFQAPSGPYQSQQQSQSQHSQPVNAPAPPGEDTGTLSDIESLWTGGPDAVDAAAPAGSETRRDSSRNFDQTGSDSDRSQDL